MRSLISLAFVLLFAGCSEPIRMGSGQHTIPGKIDWVVERVPTTDAERTAIVQSVQYLLAATPKTLSGHDQDWDDAIKMAYVQATKTLCRPTAWEYGHTGGGFWKKTGRWYYVDDPRVMHGD